MGKGLKEKGELPKSQRGECLTEKDGFSVKWNDKVIT